MIFLNLKKLILKQLNNFFIIYMKLKIKYNFEKEIILFKQSKKVKKKNSTNEMNKNILNFCLKNSFKKIKKK